MRIAAITFSVLLVFSAQGQNLPELEAEMAELQNQIGSAETADERLEASAKFEELLIKAFDEKETFDYPFNSLPKVVKLKPDDESFRLFNWNIPLKDGMHAYRMYVLLPNGKYVEFEDRKELKHDGETDVIEPSEWYGALYYEIHPVKVNREKYYTLIGWDGKDELTTLKVLDVLAFEKKNKPTLGFPLFEKDGDLLHRRVYEYADDVIFNLKWLEPKGMIIFDRLEPKTQNLKGNYAFYGPSTAYDGYKWEGDFWKLNEFVDMTRPRSAETGAQFNFPDRPDLNRKRDKINPLIGE
jgi:hypothetical protein